MEVFPPTRSHLSGLVTKKVQFHVEHVYLNHNSHKYCHDISVPYTESCQDEDTVRIVSNGFHQAIVWDLPFQVNILIWYLDYPDPCTAYCKSVSYGRGIDQEYHQYPGRGLSLQGNKWIWCSDHSWLEKLSHHIHWQG